MKQKKEIIIIGDRVLISPETKDDRTEAGLYLPLQVEARDKVILIDVDDK